MNILIVGCGLSGATIARMASDDGHNITIIDKRNHIGGNVYDYEDADTQIRISKYGAHIFHTNNERVWQFVNSYSEWIPYTHRVLSYVNERFVPIPVNIKTINELMGLNIKTERCAKEYLDTIQYKGEIRNSEDAARARVGSVLYEMMFKNYTKKQWDKFPSELEPSVLERIPIRTDYNDRYFNDKYEGMPKYGYTEMTKNIIDSKNISVLLNTTYDNNMKDNYDAIFFTGKVDTYFNNKFGKLEYRSLKFEYETIDTEQYQPRAVINYPSEQYPYTRIVEYKHFYNTKTSKTIIAKEYSISSGEEYYPVPTEKNRETYSQYQKEAEKLELNNIYFVGRLANYKYMNMDEAIHNAMNVYDKFKANNNGKEKDRD